MGHTTGRVVTDYLESDLDNEQFLQQHIEPVKDEIKKFNLILVDLKSDNSSVSYFNNKTGTKLHLPNGIYGFDNSTMDKPWQKCVHGRDKFGQVVQKYGRKSDRDKLVQALFNVLSDTTSFSDDSHTSIEDSDSCTFESFNFEKSSAFVWSPSLRLGTRTNTVVLVDRFGECEFIERTFNIPVDPENLGNHVKCHKFKMRRTSIS